MSTRSSITAQCSDGKFRSIYCHFDGYKEGGVGEMLFKNYTDQEKIEQLLALGDLSSLGESIDCPEGHSYDTPVEGHSVFYSRDRGEDFEDVKPLEEDSCAACWHKNDQAYNYFWDGEKWLQDGNILLIP